MALRIYSPHPSITLVQDWVALLPEKTGRSLGQWITLIRKEGPATEEARRDWLKRTHRLGPNSASWLAERSVGKGAEEGDPEAYLRACPKMVSDMYAGKKAGLRPVHDALIRLALSIGNDVRACPCKTIVPLYRNHVIAQIKPSTNTRIDFGLSLGDPAKVRAPARAQDTGGFARKDRITHRIAISSLKDIDAEVKKWLIAAYDRDAG